MYTSRMIYKPQERRKIHLVQRKSKTKHFTSLRKYELWTSTLVFFESKLENVEDGLFDLPSKHSPENPRDEFHPLDESYWRCSSLLEVARVSLELVGGIQDAVKYSSLTLVLRPEFPQFSLFREKARESFQYQTVFQISEIRYNRPLRVHSASLH